LANAPETAETHEHTFHLSPFAFPLYASCPNFLIQKRLKTSINKIPQTVIATEYAINNNQTGALFRVAKSVLLLTDTDHIFIHCSSFFIKGGNNSFETWYWV
jgi:hypothetical protein